MLFALMVPLLFAPAVASATTYTHLWFSASPPSIPINGVTNIILSTIDNSSPPTGTGNNLICSSLPCIPSDPSCPSGNFINATVNQIRVTTPNDPTGHDAYMLGSSTHPASTTSHPAKILITKLNQPLLVPYGPGQGGFSLPTTGGNAQYYWWSVAQNGLPTNQPQPLTLGAPASPSPTGLSGKYAIDIEGVMYCTTSNQIIFKGAYFFDIIIIITTPEFGSFLVAMGIGSLAIVFLRRKALLRSPL